MSIVAGPLFTRALALAIALVPCTAARAAAAPETGAGTPAAADASRVFDVARLGADATGARDSTAALQAAVDDWAKAGGTLELPAGTFRHHGLRAVIPPGAPPHRIAGEGTLVFSGDARTTDAFVVATAPDGDAADLTVRSVTFQGGKSAFKVLGSGKGIFRRVLIEQATFDTAALSALWLTHVDGATIRSNTVLNGGDNGIYAEFSAHVVVRENVVTDCSGSGSITVGYGDKTLAATDLTVADNLVRVTAGARDANYISGITVVFATHAVVTGNTVRNEKSAGKRIRTGIVLEEWRSSDIEISRNTIVAPAERGIRVGTNPNSSVTDVLLSGNTILGAGGGGLDGIALQRAQRVRVLSNRIEDFGHNGVDADASCNDLTVRANQFRRVGIQANSGGALAAVRSAAPRTTVDENTFAAGQRGGVLTSTAPEATVVVDTRAAPARLVLRYRRDAATAAVIPVADLTWSQLARQVAAVAVPAPGAWRLELFPGSADQPATPIRRTGSRAGADVAPAAIPPQGLYLGEPEPYAFVILSGPDGHVGQNTAEVDARFNPPDPFAADRGHRRIVAPSAGGDAAR